MKSSEIRQFQGFFSFNITGSSGGSAREIHPFEGIPRCESPLVARKGSAFLWGMVEFTTDDNPDASCVMTEFRRKQVWRIGPKERP